MIEPHYLPYTSYIYMIKLMGRAFFWNSIISLFVFEIEQMLFAFNISQILSVPKFNNFKYEFYIYTSLFINILIVEYMNTTI